MPNIRTAIVVLIAAYGLTGCGGRSTPTAASPVVQNPTTSAPLPTGLTMRGSVSDTAFRHLVGATVEVLNGPDAGMKTTSNIGGEFSFTGAFDEATEFRASLDGYATATTTLRPFCQPCNPHRWAHFDLEVLAARVNVAGDYSFEFIADSACAMLPNEVRTRTYAATIPPIGNGVPYVGVQLTGAMAGSDVITMGVAGDYVAFWLEPLIEQVTPSSSVTYAGLAAASIGAASSPIVLSFDGSIEYSARGVYGRCESRNHRLILTRR